MANILGLHGIQFNSGTEKLIAVWHKSAMFIGSSFHEKSGPNLTDGQDTYFANFLDSVYMVNGTDGNFQYNGGDWLNITSLYDSPIAQFIKLGTDTRLYLYKIKIAGVSYPSRVWFSDLPKGGSSKYSITWGLETGSDLIQGAGSAVVNSTGSSFITRNIKVGDPFVITSGGNAGEYTVQSIDGNGQITLTTSLSVSATGSSFWVGSNWFDVHTDDGDLGNGIGEVSNELLFFKKKSVHRYNVLSKTLRKVKNAPGTTSPRSIVEGSDGNTYWYHPSSGIVRTSGVNGQSISAAVEDIIDVISSANQSKVCGWEEEGRKIVFAVGDVTLRDGETITSCELAFDEGTENWEIRSRDRQILVATNFLTSTGIKVYGGDGNDGVFELNTGNSFSGTTSVVIPFALILHPIYPAGSETIVNFTRIRVYVDGGPDIQILYRLYYRPGVEKQWYTDQGWSPLKGSQLGERSEWYFPNDALASGVQLKIIESSTDKSFLIKKIVLYYSNESNR